MDEPRAYTFSQDSPRPGLGESHHLPLYSIIYDQPWGYIQTSCCPTNFQNCDYCNLEAHNFQCEPTIEVRFKEKLQPSLRVFQRYVACHLHVSKLRQLLTFNAQESNWYFDLALSVCHNLCLSTQMGHVNPFKKSKFQNIFNVIRRSSI